MQEVETVEYTPEYAQFFKLVNEGWITRYFTMEASDYKSLDHPQEYILDKGGYILIALYQKEQVGACALIKMDAHTFELAKMAVSPAAQGKGIGLILGKTIIEKARQAGAKKLYLESNSILKPAVSLYHKLGFSTVTGISSPYERCDIQMELAL